MTKKFFISFTTMLLCLFVGVGNAWGQDISDVLSHVTGKPGPDDLHYVQLVASPSPAASGTVQLTWIDMMGETINTDNFEPGDANLDHYTDLYNSMNPNASGNPNPTRYLTKAQSAGATVIYGDIETTVMGRPKEHIYMTSYAYFKAEPQPADGWCFDDWAYIDNGLIKRIDTLVQESSVLWPTNEKPNNNRAVIFKLKPHDQKGAKYLNKATAGQAAYDSTFRYVTAIFKPVLLTGFTGGKSEVVATEGNTTTFEIKVAIEAKKSGISEADLADPVLGNTTNFEQVGSTAVSAEGGNVIATITIRYTAPAGVAVGDVAKTKLTVASKGGSTIEIPLEVRAVAAERTEATLYNADKSVVIKDTALLGVDGVLAAITGTDQVLQINKNFASDLTLSGKTVTLDLNGYNVNSLTINGGTVTVAFNRYGGEGGALNVTSGKAILNGSTFSSLTISAGATVEQNGATITGAITNHGILTTTEGVVNGGLTSDGTLTINGGTFKGETAVAITGGTATINRGTITGTTCGLNTTSGTTTIEKKLVVVDGGTNAVNAATGTLIIKNGKFGKTLAGSPTLINGYFKTKTIGVALPEGKQLMNVSAGSEYAEGYRYFVGDADDALASGVGVCRIGSTSYARLEDAIAYANNNPTEEGLIILMTNDYILPAGYYTLPANATIVVPMSDEQDNSNSIVPRTVQAYSKPSAFRHLTFASGVKMEVFGSIEVSCTQHAYDTGNGGYNSNPWGPYGLLTLEEGAKLTLQNGAHIYAWGFIVGRGEIDARRGATIHEQFQMGDWKGGSTSFAMLTSNKGVFPVTQYWIQNVECPATFHPGSILAASAAVSVYSGMVVAYANDINIVGVNGRDDAMFLLDNEADADNTWIRKWYDVDNDQQVYEVNNTAHIGSLVLRLGKLAGMNLDMNSGMFQLPITNNMKIHLLSGFMDFTQDTYLLPGSMVEVDKKSVVSISINNEVAHSGSLYIYDADDWGNYIIDKTGGKKFSKAVLYEPNIDGKPSVHPETAGVSQKDATVLVHGQFDTADGFVYTSNGGASIISTNDDAGTFTFAADVPNDTKSIYHADGTSIDEEHPDVFSPAKLKNAEGVDPQYSTTGGMAAGLSYCYMNDRWTQLKIDPHDANFMREWFGGDSYGGFYIKPAEYIKVTATKAGSVISGNTDHTFSDAAGAGRLFILVETEEGYPQWWEVEKEDNLYHCIHPNNDTYYYWNGTKWVEKTYTIKWKNWDGTILKTIGPNEELVDEYEVTYGTQAEFLGTNPTREENVDYTYNFTGWNPTPDRVTQDVTYTATFEAQPRKYTIIFEQEGGVEIERQFLTHNEIPVCENMPTKVGYILQWKPAIAAVTGDATYRATWLEEPPTKFEITFVDYNGTRVLKQDSVAVGADPDEPEIVGGKPTCSSSCETGKPATDEYTYVFDHWSPTVTKVTQAMTYTAVYREESKLYTVKFVKENGDPDTPADVIETSTYHYGETPVCSNPPTKAATPEWTYLLAWTPQIQSIVGTSLDPETPIVYTADFETYKTKNKYSVTVKCNPSGAATITGNGIYDYNASSSAMTITVTPNSGYNFTGWSDNQAGNETSRSMAITGDINLVANFECPSCDNVTIQWLNYDGSELKTVNQAIGTATTYTGSTPTKPATPAETYTFDGWSTTQGGERVYKNGMTPKAAEGGATYYAHFVAEAIPSLEIPSGIVNLTAPVSYQNLILTSNGVTSGQILGADTYLTLSGHAYFDFAVNAQARKWYAVSVPWQVDAQTGISVNGRTLTLGRDFDIVYYNGEERANNGTNKAWNYVEDDVDKTLLPGRTYMIAFISNAPVIRFEKKAGAPFLTTTTAVLAHPSGVVTDANWNGVGNPALFHAFVNAGTEYGQVYNPNTDSYSLITLSSTKLVVGQGVYVQAPASASVEVAYGASFATSAPTPAPRRAKAEEELNINYEVRIAPINKDYTDCLFAKMNTKKTEDVYTIGQDLVKMGVSPTIAQMWINRYDNKLCLNTMAPTEGNADYPLGISIPEDGEYTINIVYSTTDNANAEGLYLTLNGEVIWDLSKKAYTTEFKQGILENYGLRIRAKAPQVTTDINDIVVEHQDATATKVLRNNQIFIIRGNEEYTITGTKVK